MRAVTNSINKTNRSTPKRLVLGFVALASAAVVGAAGFAGATPKKVGSTYPGPGSGNGNTINTEVNVDVSGNNNWVSIAFNYVIGR